MAKFLTNSRALILIFLLALFLRVYKLAEFPVGFHVDEVKVGWNALSILKTGLDDHGNKFPLYYNSFGDYRPTGIFYFTIPSLAIFGRNEFAVRFPSALFGALTIFPIYFFTQEITRSKKIALLASLILALDPWHIEVSRATSEAVIAIFLTLSAMYFGVKKRLVITMLLIFLSYFFYHSTRLLTPIFLGIMIYYTKPKSKTLFYAGLFALFLTIIFGLQKDAWGRLSQVSISKDPDIVYEISNAKDLVNNRLVIYAKRGINEYVKYFESGFLIGYDARPYRYITPGVGLLTYIEFLLLIIGVIQIVRKKGTYPLLLLLLTAPLPAALTTEDSPNLMRALYMIPFICIIGAYGFNNLSNQLEKIIFAFFILNFVFFIYMYFAHSAIHRPLVANADMDASSYRNIGTKELVETLRQVQDKYDKIVVTGFPDNVRPWYEFFIGEIVPPNIYFTNLKCASDDSFVEENPKKLLAVDSWECSPESKIKDGLQIKITDKILRPDGSAAFTFLERK